MVNCQGSKNYSSKQPTYRSENLPSTDLHLCGTPSEKNVINRMMSPMTMMTDTYSFLHTELFGSYYYMYMYMLHAGLAKPGLSLKKPVPWVKRAGKTGVLKKTVFFKTCLPYKLT